MSEQLAAIKKLYFTASKATIQTDFETAIDLLKAMSTDEERERAAVFMDGLAQMRAEWSAGGKTAGRRRVERQRPSGRPASTSARASGVPQSEEAPGRFGRSKDGGRRPRSGD